MSSSFAASRISFSGVASKGFLSLFALLALAKPAAAQITETYTHGGHTYTLQHQNLPYANLGSFWEARTQWGINAGPMTFIFTGLISAPNNPAAYIASAQVVYTQDQTGQYSYEGHQINATSEAVGPYNYSTPWNVGDWIAKSSFEYVAVAANSRTFWKKLAGEFAGMEFTQYHHNYFLPAFGSGSCWWGYCALDGLYSSSIQDCSVIAKD